jgi:hypothetical protein
MTEPAPAPLPSDSVYFAFACRCLNVQITGRLPLAVHERVKAGPSGEGSEVHQVWMGKGAENDVSPTVPLISHGQM